MSLRAEKMREFLKEEVSQIIHHELNDPRIGFVSITDVELSVDLRYARIFVSVLGDEAAKAKTMEGLHSAQRFIRGALGKRMQIRYTPEVTFRLDDSIERGTRVVSLLREVSEGDRRVDPAPADRDDPAKKP